MKISQLRASNPLTYDDHPSLSFTSSILQCQTNAALENRARSLSQGEEGPTASPDPFTFYKTYLNTPLLGDHEDLESIDIGCQCQSGAAAYNASTNDAQQQARGHTAAYKLAVRLANRSNGAPLATIVEQGSYSTLNSHGSLLNVGRFPSLKATENTSPNRGSRRRSRSLDEKALHDIQEDLTREYDACTVAVPHARLDTEHGAADETSRTATPSTSYRFELQQAPSQSDDELSNHDNRGVKGFVRGVLRTVRGVSGSRSRSSSLTHLPIMEHRESPPSTDRSSPQLDQEGQGSELYHLQNGNRNISTQRSQAAAVVPASGNQIRNRAISSLGVEHSACTYPLLPYSRSALTDSTTVSGSTSPALPDRATTSSHVQPFSKFAARPGTRDVAREDGTTQAVTSHHDMFDTSARHTVNDVPLYCKHLSSSQEGVSSARDIFANQNASFCSTMSTSYSGTVLGVDLDLQHDFNNLARRSQSPPTPVWFTPQMAELERQASFSESPEPMKAYVPAYAPSRSITSSALTSLLPIAAASGIVRPIYNTPDISFYSPSGNLIQPESSSHRSTSPSEYGSSPNVTTSHYNKQYNSAGSLPIRSTLVPMTTLPIHKTPLSPHLQHYHSYHRPEKSQITSCKSAITPKGPVKGCDGVVRENSLTPRSGVFYPHGRDRIHRSIKMILHDLKAEVKFYKARFIALAAAQSFAPSQRLHVCKYDTYARNPHVKSTSTTGLRKGGCREDVFGPLAAHALRVCFCQPYDGAGKPTHATAAAAFIAGELVPRNGKSNAGQHAKDVEQALPNARIVGSRGRSQSGDAKRTTRRDSAIGSIARGASRTGMMRKMD